jgi:pimeloyl-ACP methyl ester carboxylesterase
LAPADDASLGNVLVEQSTQDGAALENTHTGVVPAFSLDPLLFGVTPVTLHRIDSSDPINPNLETWIVIHGLNSSASDMMDLARAVDGDSGNAQVLTLDWSVGALPVLFLGEMYIEPVANWTAQTLATYGFNSSAINLIGHSWGAVMTAEIAEALPGGVNRVIALDPAEDAWPIAGGTSYDTDDVNFAAHSTFSWAFLSSELGSGESAPRADAAFMVDIEGDNWVGIPAHTHITELFTTMLNRDAVRIGNVSSLFGLDNVNSSGGVWTNNSFDGNAVTGRHTQTSGLYEGVLYATQLPEGIVPTSFEYFSGTYTQIAEDASLAVPRQSDFNGDGYSDALWRNNSTGDYGYSDIHGNAWRGVGGSSTSYNISGVGDFNRDGYSDVLMRNNSNGAWGYVDVHGLAWNDLGSTFVAYVVTGVDDFNRDGYSDVLWRNNSNGNWGYSDIHNGLWRDLGGSSTSYNITGIGDFNDDGYSDVLWRNNANGFWGYSDIHNLAWHDLGSTSVAYRITGVGDFNGDTHSDVLWRNDANGAWGYSNLYAHTWTDLGSSSTAYNIVDVNDFNRDGYSDALWSNSSNGAWGYSDIHGQTWHDFGGFSTAWTLV